MKKIIEFLISMLRFLVRWFVSKDEDKPTEPDNRAKRRREHNELRKSKALQLRDYRIPRDVRREFGKDYAQRKQRRDKDARNPM